MEEFRTLTNQLADDLTWLEEHCQRSAGAAAPAVELRLAAALVRNLIGPFLEGRAPTPLHVAVVGGAGAGKSTVANFLSGAADAEANPQAGFTRHPVGYATGNGDLKWPVDGGMLGRLRRLSEPAPANLDEDVYQIRRVPRDGEFSLLDRFVVWDCPDMTTWASAGYGGRLLEVAALADVIVYVASDERYNDEVPTRFLHLLLQAGKPVVVCLMKMSEANAAAMLAHFQRDVASRLSPGIVASLAIPFLTPEQRADPKRLASAYTIPLLNQLAVLADPPADVRRRSARRAVAYLCRAQRRLLGVARDDLAALEAWRNLVQAGREEFDRRYRREYLTSEKFRRFDEALVRLLDLLELPGGAGRVISNALWVVRTPYRLARTLINKALARPETRGLPEQEVLDDALDGWLDLLRKEAARRGSSKPVWAHLERGFHEGLGQDARDQFHRGLREFRLGLAEEVERTARALYEDLEKNPVILNTLRGGKFTLDMAAVAGAVATGGLAHWPLDFLLVPLAASVSHHLVEALGKQFIDNQREETRNRQQALVGRLLSGPLAEWLIEWPASRGSAYQRLHQALARIPAALSQLSTAVSQPSETAASPATMPEGTGA